MAKNIEHKKYDIIISPVVYFDLSAHVAFLARVSVNAAKKLKAAIMKDIRSLTKMPDRNPVYERPWLTSGRYRYKLSNDRYRIVYEIVGNTVRVNGIEDCRQDDKSERY